MEASRAAADRVRCTTVQEVVDHIVARWNPEKIILFGSHAYGEPHADSDIDLLVIMPFEGKGYRMAARISHELDVRFDLDLRLRTPLGVAERLAMGDPYFQRILADGQLLYETDC